MIYIYSTPDGQRRCFSREELPRLTRDFVQAFPDEEDDRAWELLHSLDQGDYFSFGSRYQPFFSSRRFPFSSA